MAELLANPMTVEVAKQTKQKNVAKKEQKKVRRLRRKLKKLSAEQRLETGLQVELNSSDPLHYLRRIGQKELGVLQNSKMPAAGLALNRLQPGMSKEGFNWAMYCLDPASVPLPSGVPDYRTGGICVLPNNINLTFSCPNSGWKTWCACFITTSFPSTIGWVIAAQTQTDLEFCLNHADSVYLFTDSGFNEWKEVSASHTFEGKQVYSFNILSDVITRTVGDDTNPLVQYRTIGRSVTLSPNGPQLNYGGRIISGQVEPSLMHAPPSFISNTEMLPPSIFFTVPIQSVAELQRVDPRRGERDFIKGDYNVLRLNIDRRYPKPYTVFYDGWLVVAPEGSDALVDLKKLGHSGNTTLFDDNFMWGCTFCLDLDLTTGVVFKLCSGLEIVPSPESAFSRTTHPAPARDDYALDFMADAVYLLGHSYPADYNDFRTLLRKIWGVARKVIPGAALIGSTLFPTAAPTINSLANALAKIPR